ncbi:MAG: bifunctional DNA primase/polymerase [Tepidisphaeraceae bacterium]|jgi:hypothetical protein
MSNCLVAECPDETTATVHACRTHSAKSNLETVVFDTPRFNGYEIVIDSVRLAQFLSLARMRWCNPIRPEGLEKPTAEWHGSRGAFAVVQYKTTDPSIDEQIEKMKFGPQLSRLLMAIHVRVMAAKNLHVKLEKRWLADMIWGAQTRRPRNWRTSLAESITAARLLWVVREGNRSQLIGSVNPVEDGFIFNVTPNFIGEFCTMLRADRSLEIIESRPDPKARITDKEIAAFEASDPYYQSDQLSKREIKQSIREQRSRDAHKPSIQNIGRRGRLWNLFVPGVLGNPSVCAKLGPLAILLFRERTRSKKPVEKASVPGWSGKAKVKCPLLEADIPYVAFAANGPNRRGRGYKLATWAERLETDVNGLLEMLTTAKSRLGLVVAGLDSDGSWYDLDQIRAADVGDRSRINVRIYTRADDFITRWCEVFGWSTIDGNPASTTGGVGGEIAELASIIRDRGIRSVAKAVGHDPSNLSKILGGKRKPRAELMAKIRGYVRKAQIVGGKGPGTIFANCQTNLDFALAYRQLGWSVIPVRQGTKRGIVKWKQYQATLPTISEIRGWWAQWPDAGIGLILGPASGVFAIDVDGKEGYDALIAQLGAEPVAPKAMSGSGDPFKMHLFFRHPPCRTKSRMTPWHSKLEFRGHAGLIVLAPSKHKSGNRYRWVDRMGLEDRPLPGLPEQVLKALGVPAAKPLPAASVQPASVPAGIQLAGITTSAATAEFLTGKWSEGPNWNQRLFNASCELKARGVAIEIASPLLIQGAKPRNDQERAGALATIQSAYSRDRNLGRIRFE